MNAKARAALKVVDVESPCSVPWESMEGDERARFCGQCRKHVFNLSAMSEEEAAEFVGRGGPACITFFRREDGTVATQDCAVEMSRATRMTRRVALFATASMFALFGVAFAGDALHGMDVCMHVDDRSDWRQVPVLGLFIELFDPANVSRMPTLKARTKIRTTGKIISNFGNYTN